MRFFAALLLIFHMTLVAEATTYSYVLTTEEESVLAWYVANDGQVSGEAMLKAAVADWLAHLQQMRDQRIRDRLIEMGRKCVELRKVFVVTVDSVGEASGRCD